MRRNMQVQGLWKTFLEGEIEASSGKLRSVLHTEETNVAGAS